MHLLYIILYHSSGFFIIMSPAEGYHFNSVLVIVSHYVSQLSFLCSYSDYDYPDGDDGLDPDIELEMEAFIEEIEEHLLMQDFDPDL